MKNPILTTFAVMFLNVVAFGGLSGLKNVGPGGNYTTLTAAFADITAQGLSGSVSLKLITGYTSAGETFPLSPPVNANFIFTITVYPGVSGLSITSANSTGTITFSGSGYIIFDGRVNATGSTKDLVIDNTSTSAYTIGFSNDASNNTVKYCTVKGVTTSFGVIYFGNGVTNGNNNNIVDNCDVRDGTTKPSCCILSNNTAGSSTGYNKTNTISNCNIYNFYLNGAYSVGIYLQAGTTGWNIQNNSIYQSAALSPTTAIGMSPIQLAVGDGYTISGNYIGGSAPLCGGTGWVMNGNGTPPTLGNYIYPIRIYSTVGTVNPILIQNNTIANIKLYTNGVSTNDGSLFFDGILIQGGYVNVIGNTIGSTTGNGSISITIGSGAYSNSYYGIDFRAGSGIIQNNSVGSITLNSSMNTSGKNNSIVGINVSPSTLNTTLDITGNTIGSLTTAASIQGTNSNTSGYLYITGLQTNPLGGTAQVNIQNNTISKVTNNSACSSSYLIALRNATAYSPTTIADNSIHDLTSLCPNISTTNLAAIVGLSISATKPGQILRHNELYNFYSTAASAAVTINGIYVGGASSTTICERNFIHGMSLASSSTSASVVGIMTNGTGNTGSYNNNMIQLGTKPDGTSLTGSYYLWGVWDVAGINNFYFNSIYIGGTATGATASYAFYSSVSGTTRIFENNIFHNARTGGTAKHYAVRVGGTSANPAGLTIDYNDYLVSGSTIGYFNSLDVSNLAAWRTTVGQDANSMSVNPQFIFPNGGTGSVNLHISTSVATPVESHGIAISGITDDIDGNVRASLTPTDIGADAGNFIQLDFSGPTIQYTAIGNTVSLGNMVLTDFATITHPNGVNFFSGTSPRLYYKKSTDANTYAGNASAYNGWKWVQTTSSGSPASFTINYSLLYNIYGENGSVVPGDVIQYFIVAQSNVEIPVVGINAGIFNSVPASVFLSPAVFPITGFINSYTIANPLNGTINVGTGNTFTTLTADAPTGLFKYINNNVVSGNLTINITSNIVEPGTIALSQWMESGGSNFTLTIQPDGTTMRVLSGTGVATGAAMIPISGADRVTIDGRSGGAGKYLTFRNTNSVTANTGPTLSFSNGSVSCTLRNCIIENNNTSSSSVYIGTGFNTVNIIQNEIRDAIAGTAGRQSFAVYVNSIGDIVNVSDNNIYNFTTCGIYLGSCGDFCTISGNNLYYNYAAAANSNQYGIWTNMGVGHTINGNYIGGSAGGCGGTAWINSAASSIIPILVAADSGSAVTIHGNVIKNLSLTNTGSAYINGIQAVSGVVNITGNMIGDALTPGSITTAGSSPSIGISMHTGGTIANNTVAYLNSSSNAPSNIYGINLQNDVPLLVENNFIYNIGASGSGASNPYPMAGIMNQGSATTMTHTYIIRNNAISLGTNVNNDVPFYGIWDFNAGSKSVYYYNSVYIGGSVPASPVNGKGIAFVKRSTSDITLKNSIFAVERGGLSSFSLSAVSPAPVSDYNDMFCNIPAQTIRLDGTAITLASWQTSTSQDFHSTAGNPLFTSAVYLQPITGSPAIGAAFPMPGVVDTDINGNPRSATSPTMGAYETGGPTITGPAMACVGSSGNVYSTESGHTNYQWTVSSGGTVTAGGGSSDNSVTVTWNTAGTSTVSVLYTSTPQWVTPAVFTATVNPLPVPTITGLASVCEGTTDVPYTTEAGMTGYSWTIYSGGTITGGQGTNTVTVTWITAGAKTISVNYSNGNGCTGASATVKNITVNALPVPTISGDLTNCEGTTDNFYTTETDMTNYVWTISPGGTITSGGTGEFYAIVTWNSPGAQAIGVSYTDENGCTAASPSVQNVTIYPRPVPTITGAAASCAGTSGVTYSTETGMSAYSWTISPGGTITSGSTGSTVTVTWNSAGDQTISVIYRSAHWCLPVSPTVKNVTVSSRPVPTISGLATVCAGTTGVTYTTESGMTGYSWSVSSGGTITGGSGTNAITVSWNTSGAKTVSVNYINSTGCTASSATVKNVTVNALPVPTITGNATVCAGTSGVTYSTEAGMTGYAWSISAGGAITGGSGANSVTVTWNTAGAQTISVNYTNPAGCTAAAPTLKSITVNPLTPVSISVTSSANNVCAGTEVTYNATVVNGGSNPVYQWYVNDTLMEGAAPDGLVALSGSSFTYIPNDGDEVRCVQIPDIQCPDPAEANSNVITMTVNSIPAAPVSGGNPTVCINTLPAILGASAPGGCMVDWYNSPSGGTLLLQNSAAYTNIDSRHLLRRIKEYHNRMHQYQPDFCFAEHKPTGQLLPGFG